MNQVSMRSIFSLIWTLLKGWIFRISGSKSGNFGLSLVFLNSWNSPEKRGFDAQNHGHIENTAFQYIPFLFFEFSCFGNKAKKKNKQSAFDLQMHLKSYKRVQKVNLVLSYHLLFLFFSVFSWLSLDLWCSIYKN